MRLLLIGGGTVSESQLNCQDFLNSCNEERSDETRSNIGGNMEKSSNITLRDIYMSYIANKISASQDILMFVVLFCLLYIHQRERNVHKLLYFVICKTLAADIKQIYLHPPEE